MTTESASYAAKFCDPEDAYKDGYLHLGYGVGLPVWDVHASAVLLFLVFAYTRVQPV
ncbi:MAG: hypothetical protein H6546_02890 [Chitinophagales bacterium]|nr:hypothetical protein [Chitinophagales bacterium]